MAFPQPTCTLCCGTGRHRRLCCPRCGGTGVPQRLAAPRLLAALEGCRSRADIEAALLAFSLTAPLPVSDPYLAGADDGEVRAATAVWVTLTQLYKREITVRAA